VVVIVMAVAPARKSAVGIGRSHHHYPSHTTESPDSFVTPSLENDVCQGQNTGQLPQDSLSQVAQYGA